MTPPSPDRRPYKPRKRQQARSTPEAIARWERDYECVKLRKVGVDFVTIAERLNYSSPGHAHDRFMSFMREYPRDDVETMRDQTLDSIELKMHQLEDKCAEGNERAVDVWNKLSERKAKLMGLDKPERKEITVLSEDTVSKAIREAEEELDRINRGMASNIPANHPEKTA